MLNYVIIINKIKGGFANKMTQEEAKKIKELIDTDSDIKKCKEYYERIINRDYSCIDEAISFTNNKYDELFITDTDIVLVSNITKTPGKVNQDLVNTALGNLKCLNGLLVAKVCKEVFNNK